MAGMLPGVEAARRRKFHRSHTNNDGAIASRRPSFCLYASNNNHEFHFSSHSSLERSPTTVAGGDDEMLDAAVREAKKRLDQRLHCKSGNKRKVKGQEEIRVESEGSFKTNLYKLMLMKSG